LLLKHSNSDMICRITLTSVLLREDHVTAEGDGATAAAAAGAKAAPPKDPLPKVPCLEALAELRHAKWFQVRCSNLQSAAITLRILRDVRQRVSTWQPLRAWAAELLVEKVLSSLG
uniref:DZF domain-containing protein n=1 Tax=Gongylonema pulchrum TaxID=637853 RepID=A0A183CYH0_9BILA